MSNYVAEFDLHNQEVSAILADELEYFNSIFTPSHTGTDPLSLIGEPDTSYDRKGHSGNVTFIDRHDKLEKIKTLLGCRRISNSILYPENGFMGWHTNSNAKGGRVYVIYNYGPSCFAYVDPDTGETVCESEPVGKWFARKFIIPEDKLLWHGVGSSSGRISFGFYV